MGKGLGLSSVVEDLPSMQEVLTYIPFNLPPTKKFKYTLNKKKWGKKTAIDGEMRWYKCLEIYLYLKGEKSRM
jgi:hypothetical protein